MKLEFSDKIEVLTIAKRCQLFSEAERNKEKIEQVKKIRDPFYLELGELDDILHFKLQNQYYGT